MKINNIFNYSLIAGCLLMTVEGSAWAEKATVSSLPNNTAGSYLSSQFARDNGNIKDAVEYLRRVHKDDPANLDIARQLQAMLLIQGKIDDATTIADDIRKSSDEKDTLSDLLVVLREVKNNNFEHAASLLDAATEGDAAQLWQPLIDGWLDVAQKTLHKPLKMEELAADVGHAQALVNYHLALINAAAGFKDTAANDFKDAIEDPRDPPVHIMHQLLRFYADNKEPAALKAVVTAYRQSHPDDIGVDAALISTPQNGIAEVLYTMGSVMIGAGASNDAAIYLQLALYIKPDFTEATLVLADAYNDLQQYDRANALYATIASNDPFYKQSQMHIAINEERVGKLDDALNLLDKLANSVPGNTDIYVTKGDLLRIHSRYQEAIDSYNRALDQIPQLTASYWPVLFARGSCYERLNQWNDAEDDLRQALTLKPDQPDVLNYLGYGLLERGKDKEEARKMIETAVKQRPDDAQIVDSMGWALYLQGSYADATPYLEKAVQLLPSDPEVNNHLGDDYWRVGRKTEAKYQWQRALTYSPDEKLAESLNKKLQDGLPTTVAETVKPTSDATP